jgi:Family of unknown function (DUF5330)
MMFLMRTAFWVSVALALLPSFVSGQSKTVPTDVGTSEAATAASATFADLSHFCDRRPDACAAGAQFASAFGQRAQAGAKIVYEFVGDRLAKQEHPAAGNPVAANLPAETPAADAAKASQQTLTSADMAPAWRGPSPRRDAKRPT